MSKKTEAEYEVGYGKPPSHSRFKAGRSGNPKGRPKGSKSIGIMAKDTIMRKVTIVEGGKPKKVNAVEAVFLRIIKGAMEGDSRTTDKLLKILPYAQAAIEAEEAQIVPAADGTLTPAKEDTETLKFFANMVRCNELSFNEGEGE